MTEHAHLLPRTGTAIDVACGRGRHALWLAQRGLDVTAVDRDLDALLVLSEAADASGASITTLARDLEADGVSLGHACFDLIVCVHYLSRPLFPVLLQSMRPGGVLVYETFTRAQSAIGRPKNPAFLLEAGELERLIEPLRVLDRREGYFEGRQVASIIATNPG